MRNGNRIEYFKHHNKRTLSHLKQPSWLTWSHSAIHIGNYCWLISLYPSHRSSLRLQNWKICKWLEAIENIVFKLFFVAYFFKNVVSKTSELCSHGAPIHLAMQLQMDLFSVTLPVPKTNIWTGLQFLQCPEGVFASWCRSEASLDFWKKSN